MHNSLERHMIFQGYLKKVNVFVIKRPYFLVSCVALLSFLGPQNAGAFQDLPRDGHDLVYKVAAGEALIDGAKSFVGTLTNRGLSFLGNEKLSQDARTREFKKLLEDGFDMKTIARFALGRYWREATDKQKKEYLSLFQKRIVDVYSARFSEYDGQNLEIEGARPQGKSDVIVSSTIVGDEGPSVKVDWRVRYKNGSYKVIDVMVEGVSMALTQRSDFSSVIQRGGGNIDVLLEHLRQS